MEVELTDVHYSTTIGVKLYKHAPMPMCKKCLNESLEDIAKEEYLEAKTV